MQNRKSCILYKYSKCKFAAFNFFFAFQHILVMEVSLGWIQAPNAVMFLTSTSAGLKGWVLWCVSDSPTKLQVQTLCNKKSTCTSLGHNTTCSQVLSTLKGTQCLQERASLQRAPKSRRGLRAPAHRGPATRNRCSGPKMRSSFWTENRISFTKDLRNSNTFPELSSKQKLRSDAAGRPGACWLGVLTWGRRLAPSPPAP